MRVLLLAVGLVAATIEGSVGASWEEFAEPYAARSLLEASGEDDGLVEFTFILQKTADRPDVANFYMTGTCTGGFSPPGDDPSKTMVKDGDMFKYTTRLAPNTECLYKFTSAPGWDDADIVDADYLNKQCMEGANRFVNTKMDTELNMYWGSCAEPGAATQKFLFKLGLLGLPTDTDAFYITGPFTGWMEPGSDEAYRMQKDGDFYTFEADLLANIPTELKFGTAAKGWTGDEPAGDCYVPGGVNRYVIPLLGETDIFLTYGQCEYATPAPSTEAPSRSPNAGTTSPTGSTETPTTEAPTDSTEAPTTASPTASVEFTFMLQPSADRPDVANFYITGACTGGWDVPGDNADKTMVKDGEVFKYTTRLQPQSECEYKITSSVGWADSDSYGADKTQRCMKSSGNRYVNTGDSMEHNIYWGECGAAQTVTFKLGSMGRPDTDLYFSGGKTWRPPGNDSAFKLQQDGDFYSIDVELNVNNYYEFKFFNTSTGYPAPDEPRRDDTPDDCDANANRFLFVEASTTEYVVNWGQCPVVSCDNVVGWCSWGSNGECPDVLIPTHATYDPVNYCQASEANCISCTPSYGWVLRPKATTTTPGESSGEGETAEPTAQPGVTADPTAQPTTDAPTTTVQSMNAGGRVGCSVATFAIGMIAQAFLMSVA